MGPRHYRELFALRRFRVTFPLSLHDGFYYAVHMLIIGLTGGIGSGKSTVSRLFANLGIPVIDTDTIAHDLVRAGQPALKKIVETFGASILTRDGELDRTTLRALVFDDPEQRQALEAILHPLIKQSALKQIEELHSDYCLLVVPLLIEKGWYTIVDRILVVDAPEEIQRQRVKQRNGIPDSQINAIMRQQATREQRLSHADDVIDNGKSIQHIELRVIELHQKYCDLARRKTNV